MARRLGLGHAVCPARGRGADAMAAAGAETIGGLLSWSRLAIVAALRLVLGRQWASRAGLQLSPAQALLAVMAFAVVATASAMLLHHRLSGRRAEADCARHRGPGRISVSGLQRGNPVSRADDRLRHPICAFGDPLISLGLALVFPAAHFLLYRFSNPMHLALSLPALATLFFAGVAMNNLYLAFRHIGFSWALHAGWNVVWLPATFYDAASHARLAEPQIFDRVLGSPIMVATACAMAVLTFVFLARRPRAAAAEL